MLNWRGTGNENLGKYALGKIQEIEEERSRGCSCIFGMTQERNTKIWERLFYYYSTMISSLRVGGSRHRKWT